MKRWVSLLMLATLAFPFFMQTGLMLRFYQQSLVSRKAHCEQKLIISCAGKCQLVKTLQSTPEPSPVESMPELQMWAFSPFVLSATEKLKTETCMDVSTNHASVPAFLAKGHCLRQNKPPMYL